MFVYFVSIALKVVLGPGLGLGCRLYGLGTFLFYFSHFAVRKAATMAKF